MLIAIVVNEDLCYLCITGSRGTELLKTISAHKKYNVIKNKNIELLPPYFLDALKHICYRSLEH